MKNKNKNIVKFLPNTITVMNMAMGLSVIFIFSYRNNSIKAKKVACLLIFIAVVLDFLDGKLARKFDVVSDIGKQLDSFADIISFGLAPMMIMYYSVNFEGEFRVLLYFVILMYVVCGVMRLARYNVGNFTEFFLGVPITVAGLALVFYFLVSFITGFVTYALFSWISLILAVVLGVLMVSSFKVPRLGKKKSKSK